MATSVEAQETQAAVQKYGTFVEEVLKPQLQASLAQRDALTTEIREYQELLEFLTAQIERQQTEPTAKLQLLMDLGQRFQVRAKINDPTRIIVDIGLNFHVEMTLDEAQTFVQSHLTHLSDKRRTWQDKARQISDHVNLVLDAIQQLAALQ
ncbi:hypothetical protein Poli38472_014167 [Pythium oligandrum]|uniref:Prefoldin subunit 3 n=1 Tax=Pythium oligandrum TaxID=41045 RepID=A0A8K1FHM2_PYTOL|nr:hypothetical protein Poli38472_014167 [Pythium oligandrum]|eukprot:TMW64050.1 hypothetical protein Poli38472_014167 [Pythium oligandrum]